MSQLITNWNRKKKTWITCKNYTCKAFPHCVSWHVFYRTWDQQSVCHILCRQVVFPLCVCACAPLSSRALKIYQGVNTICKCISFGGFTLDHIQNKSVSFLWECQNGGANVWSRREIQSNFCYRFYRDEVFWSNGSLNVSSTFGDLESIFQWKVVFCYKITSKCFSAS